MWTTEIEELMRRGEVPGLSIAVLREGKIAWNRPFGRKNGVPDGKTDGPVDESTLFPAASLSKPVFAYIALRLMERGILDLDRQLYTYLSYPRLEHDERYRQITARQVLSHSSGLPNWGGTPLKINFTPGERFGYSGEGFMFLQAVAEKLMGESLEVLAQAEVFGPLQMTRSTFVWSDTQASNLVTGCRGGTKPQVVNDAKAASAYSMLTTSEDYARFVLAIIEGTGLKTETAEQMLTPQIQAPRENMPSGVAWGLGWGLEESDSGPCFWHWGDNGGFKCFVVASRPRQEGVVYFTNSQEGLSIVNPLVTRILGGKHLAFDWLGYASYDSPQIIDRQELRRLYLQQGTEAGLARYREMREQIPEVVNEEFTNGFGFWLQENEKQDAAIALFIENIQNYPESANTYDSLSWAYMHADQVDLALENMEKARDLEPTAANRAAQIAWMREYLQVQAQAETIPVETLRRYVGNYREHRITLNGNDLYCERTENKRAYRLVPLSADSFVIEGDVLRRLRFIAAEEKHAHKIVVTVMEEWQEEIARNGQ